MVGPTYRTHPYSYKYGDCHGNGDSYAEAHANSAFGDRQSATNGNGHEQRAGYDRRGTTPAATAYGSTTYGSTTYGTATAANDSDTYRTTIPTTNRTTAAHTATGTDILSISIGYRTMCVLQAIGTGHTTNSHFFN